MPFVIYILICCVLAILVLRFEKVINENDDPAQILVLFFFVALFMPLIVIVYIFQFLAWLIYKATT